MSGLRLYGSDYSVYVRIVRMVLHEKNLSYTLVPVDVFSADGRTPEYLKRQPSPARSPCSRTMDSSSTKPVRSAVTSMKPMMGRCYSPPTRRPGRA